MANYPTSASTDANLYIAVNNKRTFLNGAITNAQTTITVNSTTGFPTSGLISIENEVVAYTGTTATDFTGCTRGFDGTTAASHTDASTVSLRVVAAHHNNLKDETIAVETDLVAVKSALNDVDTPASTATDVKDRFDQVVSELKRITQNTNWYDAISVGLKDIAGNTFIGLGRNRIINGEMLVDQANGGGTVTIASDENKYTVDGFSVDSRPTAGVFTTVTATATPPTGFSTYLRTTVTTADASRGADERSGLHTRIEGYRIRDFLLGTASAVTLSLSFYVRSSLTGTFGGSIRNSASNRSYVFQYTINSANTWERKTISITGDTSGTWLVTTGIGMRICWSFSGGTNYQATANTWVSSDSTMAAGNVEIISTNGTTWDITGIQLEIGSVGTSFEYRPFETEVLLCQRYYEKSYNLDIAPGTNTDIGRERCTSGATGVNTQAMNMVHYVTLKRATPTITLYPTDGSPSGSWQWVSPTGTITERVTTASEIFVRGFLGQQEVTNTDTVGVGHWVADARL